jgi:DNA-binding response OmpR family regulator
MKRERKKNEKTGIKVCKNGVGAITTMPANVSIPSAIHRTYSFGKYTLDLDRGALLRAGADVKLRPKSFEVLSYLVQRHGLLVTKNELLDAIWGQTEVVQ